MDDPEEWQAVIRAHEEAVEDNGDEVDDSGLDDDGNFAVWPENWDAVVVFCQLGNCWDIDSFAGSYRRIIRSEIESALRLMGYRTQNRIEIFEKLLIMENAALKVLNRK